MASKHRSLTRGGAARGDGGILSRIAENAAVQKGKATACDVAYVAKRLMRSTGKAAWIVATSAIVLGLPLIIEMDREAQFNEMEQQQATLLGSFAALQ